MISIATQTSHSLHVKAGSHLQESFRQILKAVPATKVLMLSVHGEDAYIVEAVKSGAVGYLIKQTSADTGCAAIREVQKGNTFFSPSIPSRLHERKPTPRRTI